MLGDQRSHFLRLAVALAAAAVAPAGCNPEETLQKDGEKVAELSLEGGVTMDIVAMEDGSFIYSQSGRLGSRPHRIPEAMKQEDPVALFRHFAPSREVPRSLVLASERARAMLGSSSASDKGPTVESRPRLDGGPSVKPGAPGDLGEVLYLSDNSQSDWTGVEGCPVDFFRRNWCTRKETGDDIRPNPPCFINYEWAFVEREQATSGWGAICANDGQLTFRITRQGAYEYQVDQGSWRTAEVQRRGPCGLFSCDWERAYTRFEMMNRPTDWNSGHFAAEVYY